MNSSQRKIVIVLVLISAFSLIGITVYNHYKSPGYQQTTVNKDTGQTIINTPNKQAENGSGSKTVTILGDSKFLSAGMTNDQFTLAEQLLSGYVNNQLGHQYSQVAILNNDFSSSGTVITAKMRLGTSNTLLNLVVHFHDLNYVSVAVSDPSGNSQYTYASGDQTVPDASQDTSASE